MSLLKRLLVFLMLSFLIFSMNTAPSWSNEWNEGWRKITNPDNPEQYLLVAPWDWGRTVLTGAMAEHEELEAIKPRMASIEEQLNEVIEEMHETNAQIEERINQAVFKSYWKGFGAGGTLGFIVGLGIGIWIVD